MHELLGENRMETNVILLKEDDKFFYFKSLSTAAFEKESKEEYKIIGKDFKPGDYFIYDRSKKMLGKVEPTTELEKEKQEVEQYLDLIAEETTKFYRDLLIYSRKDHKDKNSDETIVAVLEEYRKSVRTNGVFKDTGHHVIEYFINQIATYNSNPYNRYEDLYLDSSLVGDYCICHFRNSYEIYSYKEHELRQKIINEKHPYYDVNLPYYFSREGKTAIRISKKNLSVEKEYSKNFFNEKERLYVELDEKDPKTGETYREKITSHDPFGIF